MEAVPILMVIFGGVFGGIALITRVDGQSKLRILQEKRAIAELSQAAQPPAPLPAPAPADPHAAPVLALRLPEPQRSQALALLCLVQDAPRTLDASS